MARVFYRATIISDEKNVKLKVILFKVVLFDELVEYIYRSKLENMCIHACALYVNFLYHARLKQI